MDARFHGEIVSSFVRVNLFRVEDINKKSNFVNFIFLMAKRTNLEYTAAKKIDSYLNVLCWQNCASNYLICSALYSRITYASVSVAKNNLQAVLELTKN